MLVLPEYMIKGRRPPRAPRPRAILSVSEMRPCGAPHLLLCKQSTAACAIPRDFRHIWVKNKYKQLLVTHREYSIIAMVEYDVILLLLTWGRSEVRLTCCWLQRMLRLHYYVYSRFLTYMMTSATCIAVHIRWKWLKARSLPRSFPILPFSLVMRFLSNWSPMRLRRDASVAVHGVDLYTETVPRITGSAWSNGKQHIFPPLWNKISSRPCTFHLLRLDGDLPICSDQFLNGFVSVCCGLLFIKVSHDVEGLHHLLPKDTGDH